MRKTGFLAAQSFGWPGLGIPISLRCVVVVLLLVCQFAAERKLGDTEAPDAIGSPLHRPGRGKGTGKYAGISGSGTAVATTTATLPRMKDGKCDTSATVTPVAGTEHTTIKAVGKVHLP